MAQSKRSNRRAKKAVKAPERNSERPLVIGMGATAIAAAAVVAFAILGLVRDSDAPNPAKNANNTPSSTDGVNPLVPGQRPALDTLPEGRPSLSGRVIDSAGMPIEGVTLSVTAERAAPMRSAIDAGPSGGLTIGESVVTTTTDADGRFAISALASGLHRLRLEGTDVVTAEVRYIEVPTEGLDITALRKKTIAGDVIGESTQDIVVIARGELTEDRTTASPDGSFVLSGLPEGVYRVWAEGGAVASRAVQVDARGAASTDPLELELVSAATVTGLLRDRETGSAVAGVVVVTSDFASGDDEPERRVESDAAGNYTVGSLLPGRWVAQASSGGYVPSEQLAFSADRDRTLDLELSRGGTLSGIALDPLGSPIAGVLIEATSATDGGVKSKKAAPQLARPARAPGTTFIPRGELGVLMGPIPFPPSRPLTSSRIAQPIGNEPGQLVATNTGQRMTDAGGAFELTGLRAAVYQVRASHPDYAGGIATGIVVQLGRARNGVRIVLRRGVAIGGVVRGDGSGPIIGARVEATIANSPAIGVVTDADGRYELPPLIGSITIEARAPGFASSRRVLPVAKDGAEKREDFLLERADKKLAGRVRDGAGRPIVGAQLNIAALSRTATSDNSGFFEFASLPAGKHQISVTHPKYPSSESSLVPTDSVEIELPIGGGVSGELIDDRNGLPVALASIELRMGKRVHLVKTDDRGEFTLVPIATGAWVLTAVAKGYPRFRKSLKVPEAHTAGEVSVRGTRLRLVRGATLGGTVRDENGERVSGAVVKVGELETATDIDGQFRIADVPAQGVTTISASLGDRRGDETLELDPGDERVTLDIRITP